MEPNNQNTAQATPHLTQHSPAGSPSDHSMTWPSNGIVDDETTGIATESQIQDQRYSAVLSTLSSSLASSLRWCPTSAQQLAQAESDLLSVITRPFKTYFVNIGPGWGKESNQIRTLEMITDEEIQLANNAVANTKQTTSAKQPLVLIHGFAAGIGTWILNYDTLATGIDRKIYAFDIIGFGRSSRAPFDLSGDVEGQFVDSIERWRKEKGIEKFILLGHSFGGYLSASYALKYPERISHVILADPWGVQDRQASPNRAVLRVTGPYGPRLVQKFRGDLREKFRPKLQDNCHKFLTYIYHCNAQSATGESAFKALTLPYGWPKNPLIHRLLDLDPSVSLTFIYGQRSWIEKAPGEFLRDCMAPNRVVVHIIQGSGHHVYADKYSEFNDLVKDACSKLDF